MDIQGDPYDQNFDLGGWGPITVGIPRVILDTSGDPYDQNVEPRRVGTNQGGDPLGAILDIRGATFDQNFDPSGMGTNHGGER